MPAKITESICHLRWRIGGYVIATNHENQIARVNRCGVLQSNYYYYLRDCVAADVFIYIYNDAIYSNYD